MKTKKQEAHIPVLLHEVLQYLNPKPRESYLDLTAGMGGHADAILERTMTPSNAVLIDRDPAAATVLRKKFKDAKVLQTDFLSAVQKLAEQGKRFDMILADLGVSSLHLNDSLRGFSFMRPGPLDMRMDSSQPLRADEIVNNWDEQKLVDLLGSYGQERKARTVAARIVANRPIHSTGQLAKIVASVYRFRSRIHPATRTFQALRIAVNDELTQVESSLPIMLQLLQPGGRLAVISFHSLEDRLVKRAFTEAAQQGYEAEIQLLSKKPITAQTDEIVLNPRARSAKLRAVAKIKTYKGLILNAY
ncbi:16S rRNA (cytosine(1402)-N(4))-methyltransferase RsmH [Candidatus Saccharibacteria bacterium]|nr:16S rRNA (cytosine(1402)-N(4))-methyltransferase RsmH [Candidatus Saccharibacteria bacterium]